MNSSGVRLCASCHWSSCHHATEWSLCHHVIMPLIIMSSCMSSCHWSDQNNANYSPWPGSRARSASWGPPPPGWAAFESCQSDLPSRQPCACPSFCLSAKNCDNPLYSNTFTQFISSKGQKILFIHKKFKTLAISQFIALFNLKSHLFLVYRRNEFS